MSRYLFIKSEIQMRDELCSLWDNFELYEFMKGYQWIMNREKEICECLPLRVRHDYIEATRIDWIVKDCMKS